jgi:putative ABC transport system permease protein
MANYADWRDGSHSFESMGVFERTKYRITGQGDPELADGATLSASVFRTLGVTPLAGRLFRDEEDRPGSSLVAVISYGLWQRRFGGARSVLGSTLTIGDSARTIVGIMPASFRFPDATTEIWSPLGNDFNQRGLASRGRHDATVVARLKPGISRARADAEIRAIAARLKRAYPDTNKDVGAFVAPLREHMAGDHRPLSVMLGAVAFVLLIACANVANLMLSRAVVRVREVAIRFALGASRMRVLRQLAAEHLLLAVAGGAAGALVAVWGVRLLGRLVPENLAALVPPGLDVRVLLFSLSITAATCILFSLAPMAHALSTGVNESLKQSGDRSGASRRSHLMRHALVVSEVALALVLLIGAGLMIRTFAHLRGVDPGFRTTHLLTLEAMPSNWRDANRCRTYYREVLRRVDALPGVVSSGFTVGVPLAFKGWFNGIRPEGATESTSVLFRAITPDYLQTIGVPVVQGRGFHAGDREGTQPVAMVNQTLARRFWPGRDPVGRRIMQAANDPGLVVVGVVADVRQLGLDAPPNAEYYVPSAQTDAPGRMLAVRTASPEPMRLAAAVRREIRAVDRDVTITDIQTGDDILDHEVAERRFEMLILAAFAASALVLAAIGIYGVLAYAVAQRRREIGLRMALGATTASILRNVLGEAAALIAAGLVLGSAAALALTRMMSSLLAGVSATDPVTFLGVPLLLALVGLAAGYIPARRAMCVDPALTLRDE